MSSRRVSGYHGILWAGGLARPGEPPFTASRNRSRCTATSARGSGRWGPVRDNTHPSGTVQQGQLREAHAGYLRDGRRRRESAPAARGDRKGEEVTVHALERRAVLEAARLRIAQKLSGAR